MLSTLLTATLKLLLFRAGPEEFPYEKGERLLIGCVVCALLVHTLVLSVVVPWPAALFSSLLNIGLMALVTRAILAMRKLDNRFQQTFNSLLVTNSALALVMLPFWVQLRPVMQEFSKQMMQNPQAPIQPESLPQIPGYIDAAISLIFFWQLAVTGYIFYKAAGGAALATVFLIAGALLLVALGTQIGAAI